MDSSNPTLRRTLTLPWLVLYGLGTTIGAGIYAITGAVAGSAGDHAWASFGIAALLATASGLSFAELAGRYPRSAGEAVYVREAFGTKSLSTAVGLAVATAGVISAAAVANGFAGYATGWLPLSSAALVLLLLVLLGGLAAVGVRASIGAAAVVTVVELAGLGLVLAAGFGASEVTVRRVDWLPPADAALWSGIFAGGFLAFYAFLGFEDLVNVAEEVRDVRRSLPAAVLLTLGITAVLYVAVAAVAVRIVSPLELAGSSAPLALVYERASGRSPALLSAIGSVAMINGALIQLVMASRVLYGLAAQQALPAWLARVHPRTRTPLTATLLVTAAAGTLAVAFPLTPLVRATSVVTLCVFALVNAALWRIKWRGAPTSEGPSFPLWVPALGCTVSVGFLAAELVRRLS